MKQRLIILAMLFCIFSFASAQEENKKGEKKQRELEVTLYVTVKDHLTHEKVQNLKGELLMAADSSFVDSLDFLIYDDEVTAQYDLKKEGKYLLCLHADGYVTAYTPVDASKLRKTERYRELPMVYMRRQPKRNEHELDEVVVKATKLKFYMDGDTLVYDADAFPMTEGSMLGDLMKKLPGVEVDGGVITVNGKAIDAMLLNGKNFFDKDRELMLENMPSYMVKSFNAYERVPERVKGTKLENSVPKEFVMDVRLKKEYSVGWLANAEAGGGATFFDNDNENKEGKFLGRLFGLRFTKQSRLMAFANANNLNDYRKPGDEGDWSKLNQSEGLTTWVKTGMNYRYEQDESLPKSLKYEGSIDGTYSDKNNANHTSSATFLGDGNTFGKSFYTKRSYDWEVNTVHELTYRQTEVKSLMKNIYLNICPKLYYLTWDNSTASASTTLAEDVESRLGKAWMDSIMTPNAGELLKRYAINRTMSSTKGIGHWLDASGNLFASATPAYNDYINFDINVMGRITNRGEDNYEHYMLDYPRDNAQTTDYRNRFNPTKDKTQNLYVRPSIDFLLDQDAHHVISLYYTYEYSHIDNNNPLYLLNKLAGWEHPDSHPLGMLPSEEEVLTAIDRENSSRSVQTFHYHKPSISYHYGYYNSETRTSSRFGIWTEMDITHEKQNYQQGIQIDTLMRRNTALMSGGLSYSKNSYKTSKNIYGYYRFNVSAPSMTSLLNIRNDRDPLNITLGNPNLKNMVNHNVVFNYRNKFGKTLFHSSVNGSLTTNAIAYGFIYDKETGVKTTKPQNVNGNWMANADGGVDFPFDKNDKWRLKESVSYDYNHSVDLIGTNAEKEATRSTVGSHYITDNLSLHYRPNQKMEFGISGSLTYQNSTSNRESFQTLNVFTYHYGANAQLELPLGIQLSTDLTMYSRRGYSEASMNTNELVWNARVAKKLMHGNLTLMFDGFDLLGNLSNVRRTINAQGSTETFYNVLPSYGLFHVIYRLNKQPKKKE